MEDNGAIHSPTQPIASHHRTHRPLPHPLRTDRSHDISRGASPLWTPLRWEGEGTMPANLRSRLSSWMSSIASTRNSGDPTVQRNFSLTSIAVLRRETWHNMSPENLRWYEFAVIITLATALAFVAGFVNGLTILSSLKVTVSNLTGLITRAGVSAAAESNAPLWPYEVAGSFLLGSFTSGLVIDSESWQLGPKYGLLMVVEALVLLCGYAVYHGEYQHYVMFINAYACGLQNALGTTYYGAIVRTSHITGTTTDMGIVLGHILREGLWAKDAWKLKYLVPLVCSFFSGGVVAGKLHHLYGYSAVLLPVTIMSTMGLLYLLFCIVLQCCRRPTSTPRVRISVDIKTETESPIGSPLQVEADPLLPTGPDLPNYAT